MSGATSMAVYKAVDAMLWHAQQMPARDAAAFLTLGIDGLQEKIHALSVASYRDIDPPAELAHLSVIDLMAGQSRLSAERAVRMHEAATMQVAA